MTGDSFIPPDVPAETSRRPPPFSMSGDLLALFSALAAAQAAYGPIPKTRTVQVRSDKGNYTFDYAPLDVVLEATRPALSANGIAFIQPIYDDGDCLVLRTVLAHANGGRIETMVPLPSTDKDGKRLDIQKIGAAITYLRRYSAVSLLGCVADEDDDGAAEGTQSVQARAPGPRANTRPTPPPAKPQEAPKQRAPEIPPIEPGPSEPTFATREEAAAAGTPASAEISQSQAEQSVAWAQRQAAAHDAQQQQARAQQQQPLAPPPPSQAKPATVPPPATPPPLPIQAGPITKETGIKVGKLLKALGFGNATPEEREKVGDYLHSMSGKRKASEFTEGEGLGLLSKLQWTLENP